jgi:hypothetical protein
VDWDHFYDDAGRGLVSLVRTLIQLRHSRDELRHGDHWYYSDADYRNQGVLVQRRTLGPSTTMIAVNFTDSDVTVPLTMPAAGSWTERLVGGDLITTPGQQLQLTIPSNYGRVWTYG